MISSSFVRSITLLLFPSTFVSLCSAQAIATASRSFSISAFVGGTATYTGLSVAPGVGQGKNLGLTIGGDVSLRRYFGFYPSIEIRGTDPFFQRRTDGQESILVGGKIGKKFEIAEPYVDFLFGRGRINYIKPFLDPQGIIAYTQTKSNVYSLGGGLDVAISDHFLIKFDGQLQQFKTPVTVSGHVYGKPLTLALVYRSHPNSR